MSPVVLVVHYAGVGNNEKYHITISTIIKFVQGGVHCISTQVLPNLVNCGGAIRHSMVLRSEMLPSAAFDGSCAPGVHHFLAPKVRYVVFVVAANSAMATMSNTLDSQLHLP